MPHIRTPATINHAAAHVASGHLVAKGYAIRAVHFQTTRGVLPVVATIPTEHGCGLVFCALRVAIQDSPHEPPIGAWNVRTARTLRQQGAEWINAVRPPYAITELCWDAIGVTFTHGGDYAHFEHVRAVF